MADATTDFFQALASRGPHPELENATGTLRFDLKDAGKRTARWLVALENGSLTVSRRNARADCVVRADKAAFDRVASGELNAMAAFLRGAIEVDGDQALLLPFQRLFPAPPGARDETSRSRAMSDGLVKILDGNTFVVSDARGDIEASLDRPDRPLLVRHALPLEVGADRQRRAAERALDRRPPVLRDALLPRPRHGHGLRRREALGDPQRAVGDGFHEELTILNHDEKPVDLTVRIEAGERLRRPVRGQGRAREEGHATRPRSRSGQLAARLRARDVPPRDRDLSPRRRRRSTSRA